MNVMNDQKMAKEYATANLVAWPQTVIMLILSACLLTHLQKARKATHVGLSRIMGANRHAQRRRAQSEPYFLPLSSPALLSTVFVMPWTL